MIPDFYKSLLDHLPDGVYFTDTERRISYWNSGAERISGYSVDDIMGSRCLDSILMHVDASSKCLCEDMCPLAATMRDGLERDAAVYLHHKDGHRVPVKVRVSPVRDEAGKIIGAVEVFSDDTERMAALEMVEDMKSFSLIDQMTGLANRRYLESVLESKLDEMARYDWQVAAMMINIDGMGEINDLYGTESGDRVLRAVAETLKCSAKSFDLVGRLEDDKFLILMANAPESRLISLAELLHVLVENSHVSVGDHSISVTVSIGGAMSRPEDTVGDLLARLEEQLQRSKYGGRNASSFDFDYLSDAA